MANAAAAKIVHSAAESANRKYAVITVPSCNRHLRRLVVYRGCRRRYLGRDSISGQNRRAVCAGSSGAVTASGTEKRLLFDQRRWIGFVQLELDVVGQSDEAFVEEGVAQMLLAGETTTLAGFY